MLSKKQRPVFPTDGYSLYYDKTGDAKLLSLNCWESGPNNFALWLELMARLMEGRPCATYIEQWNYDSKREIKNKTEIVYSAAFPALFAQEHPEADGAHVRLTDGWKEIVSFGTGADREMLEALYLPGTVPEWMPHCCVPTLYALERLPDCRTLAEAKACIGQPGLFALEYDICEDWADITLPDEETQAFAVKTIQEILSAHGKMLCMLDAES